MTKMIIYKNKESNILSSVIKIVKYAKKRRETAIYAVRLLNGNSEYRRFYNIG